MLGYRQFLEISFENAGIEHSLKSGFGPPVQEGDQGARAGDDQIGGLAILFRQGVTIGQKSHPTRQCGAELSQADLREHHILIGKGFA